MKTPKTNLKPPKANFQTFLKRYPIYQGDHQSSTIRKKIMLDYLVYRKKENRKWWRWYNQYLKSVEWKMISKAVRQRAKGICEKCKQKPCQHVHHLTYRNVGNEKSQDLIAVCRKCHSDLHDGKKF